MPIALTDREADLMQILWEHGASTAAEVRERLSDDLAYTTVLTVLRTLEAKGYVDHKEDGRAHRYRAKIAQQAARSNAVRHLMRKLFSGSPELLLTQLISDHKLSARHVERARQHTKRKKTSSKK
jgi:BlaI family transcriptional regulator, penicillinase repressor